MKRIRGLVLLISLISFSLITINLPAEERAVELEYKGVQGYWISESEMVKVLNLQDEYFILKDRVLQKEEEIKKYLDQEKEVKRKFEKEMKKVKREKFILILTNLTTLGFFTHRSLR